MSPINTKADGELHDRTSDVTVSGQARDDNGTPRQEAWFGISDHDGALAEGPFAGVVFNRPIEQVFTYRVPSRLKRIIQPGQRVRVPLGRGDHMAVGYCVQVDASVPGDLDPVRIKDVVEVLDHLPLIDDKMLGLTRWMADYYACSWGQALDAVEDDGTLDELTKQSATCQDLAGLKEELPSTEPFERELSSPE